MNNLVLDFEDQLKLLFTQLQWPSNIVKERASFNIAQLLCGQNRSEKVLSFLLKWIGEQDVETLPVYGLLIIAKAKMINPKFSLPRYEDIEGTVKKKSLLAWSIISDLYEDNDIPISKYLVYSEDTKFVKSDEEYFQKYIRSFVPPIYDYWASQIENKEKYGFKKHWYFEWQNIVNHNREKLSLDGIDYWTRLSVDKERYYSVDFPMSEIYVSAYLRTLAWSLASELLTMDAALFFVSQTCPVDLDLWNVNISLRPKWWPKLRISENTIDQSIAQVFEKVEDLWERQSMINNNGKLLIGHASGKVMSGNSHGELEIFGIFQKTIGPRKPVLREIVDWCRGDRETSNRSAVESSSRVRFGGVILEDYQDPSRELSFSDWRVLPIFGFSQPLSPHRWQYWRIYRRIWLPHSNLSKGAFQFRCKKDSIEIYNQEGDSIAKWIDWSNSISERMFEDVPPDNGECLQISKKIIDDYSKKVNMRFCWICRVTIHYRERDYDEFKKYSIEKAYGASNIILSN